MPTQMRLAPQLPRHWVFVAGDGSVWGMPAIANGWLSKIPLSAAMVDRSEPARGWACLGLGMPAEIVSELRRHDQS